MGTICAPAHANIFMDHFERKYIYPFLEGLSMRYLRFIDQPIFLNDLNAKHNSIKFEYKISQSSIPFLCTEVYIKNNKLCTKICRKETDRQNVLHINSEHAISLKSSIPYSQVLRVKRTCSTIENFKLFAHNLNKNLLRKDRNLTF